MKDTHDKLDKVKDYYGKVLSSNRDLKTDACCSTEAFPRHIQEILSQIEDEVLDKFYGCGSPIPPAIEGRVVLDLGCGSGRDVFILSKLVGESGQVIGVDMTEEQLSVASRHIPAMTERFSFSKPNILLKHGYIEDLASMDIQDNSVDVVVSNCVINLSPMKHEVFSEIFRVLKPGGELYFSDIFSDRRIPAEYHDDPVLHGECLSGAMYIEDFRRLLRDLGCLDYRVTVTSPVNISNTEIESAIGMVGFYSMTIRAFKLNNLEDICEDYGQHATYLGTIEGHPHSFDLDDHHRFQTGKPMLVCGNTASMLHETRFTKHFKVVGDRSVHYGPFDCGTAGIIPSENGSGSGSCC